MKTRLSTSPETFSRMTTQELRDTFLIDSLFKLGCLDLTYWEVDRMVIGSAVPEATELSFADFQNEIAADFFLQRRELGAFNIGGAGLIEVDGTSFILEKLDNLYVGRGSRSVTFRSVDPNNPAKFFLVSCPAHSTHPTSLAKASDAHRISLGDSSKANERTITQQIHEKGTPSCQLVMGFTELASGSVWNTMPSHTHQRRSEVYLYFDLPEDQAVVHLMGPGRETRHLLVHNGQAVLSPIWSIHSGCGTANYRFCWAMAGENQRFDDMDGIPVRDLR